MGIELAPEDGWDGDWEGNAYPVLGGSMADSDTGTSSETSSDDGRENIDMSDLAPLDVQQASQHVY